MLKNFTSIKEIFNRQNSAAIFCPDSPDSLVVVSAGNCHRAMLDDSGMIRNQMGTQSGPGICRCKSVALCAHPIAGTLIYIV
jgi:hypothetical protein